MGDLRLYSQLSGCVSLWNSIAYRCTEVLTPFSFGSVSQIEWRVRTLHFLSTCLCRHFFIWRGVRAKKFVLMFLATHLVFVFCRRHGYGSDLEMGKRDGTGFVIVLLFYVVFVRFLWSWCSCEKLHEELSFLQECFHDCNTGIFHRLRPRRDGLEIK